MTLLTKHWPPLLTILVCTLGGFFSLPYLPAKIPVHWGIDGSISTYSGRDTGVYLNPGAMAIAYLFFTLIPYRDKRRVKELREVGVYEPLRNTAVYAFALAQIMALGIGLGAVREGANYLAGIGCLLLGLAAVGIPKLWMKPFRSIFPRLNTIHDRRIFRSCTLISIACLVGVACSLLVPYPIAWFAGSALILLFSDRHRNTA